MKTETFFAILGSLTVGAIAVLVIIDYVTLSLCGVI
jgi:hypothetical protein